MFEATWVKDLMIVLAVAGVVVPLAARLRFGVVPAFLLAGVVFGPGGLGGLVDRVPWLAAVTFSDPDRVRPFAELGVLFLLFLIGLELSLERLWAMRRFVLGLGSTQVFLSAAAIAAIAIAYGNGFGVSVVIGLGFALSSTAIVIQMLIEARRLAMPVGRAAFGVLLFQDVMVVPIVIIVGLVGGEVAVPGVIARAIGLAVGAVGVIFVGGRFLVGPLMRLAARTGNREAVVAIALFLAIGMGLVTAAAGLSAALGAFLAGLLLGESEYRHQIEVDIDPFKGLLLGFFFMTVGMTVNPSLIATGLAIVVASVVGLLLIKGVTVLVLARLFRLEAALSVELAFLLAGAGEFAFVVLALSRQTGLLTPAAHQFFITVAALSMLSIPALAAVGTRLAETLARRIEHKRQGVHERDAEFADHVIIGGFGRVGQMIARVLDAERIPYVALDINATLVRREKEAGRSVFYGDAGRREILERLGGARARAFVVTSDASEAAGRMVRTIRAAWPNAVVHARARDQTHADRLVDAGVASAVPETLEGSLQLAGRVLAGEGLPDEAIEARLGLLREAEVDRAAAGEPPA